MPRPDKLPAPLIETVIYNAQVWADTADNGMRVLRFQTVTGQLFSVPLDQGGVDYIRAELSGVTIATAVPTPPSPEVVAAGKAAAAGRGARRRG